MKRAIIPVLAALFAAMSQAESLAERVGVYHWDGQYTTSMSEGVERVAGMGGHIVRLVISPMYYTDYNTGQGCYPQFSLSAFMREPDVKRALDDPSIDVYMLTTYDGTTWGDCSYSRLLNPAFYTLDNTAAIAQEYSDFTLYLEQTYQQTSKRFIISDWEDDNMVYCGYAYDYATDPEKQSKCDADYDANYGVSSPVEGMEGLKLWQQARQQGITDGRNRAAAEGMDVRVYFAPEFAIVHALHDNGFESVLYDVLPSVISDYVSYSAYETINKESAAAVVADLKTISTITDSRPIIIGESGFDRSVLGSCVVTYSDAVIRAALYAGAAYVFQWNLYDQSAEDEYGLFDLNGNQTALGAYFQLSLNTEFERHGNNMGAAAFGE
jgi:hypothetical protein